MAEKIVGARIHIVGGPGSGKTTLARQIAERLQVPNYDLDQIGYEKGAGRERALALKLTDVDAIAVQPGWVTEGIYLDWARELFRAAGTIIWLDLPWRVAAWRIVLRHIKADFRDNNPHTGWKKLFQFLKWCQRYYKPEEMDVEEAINRRTTGDFLEAYHDKVIHCRQPGDVRKVLIG